MSSDQEKCLQHRFNRWGIGAYHRCNDVSVQEKILSAPVEPVRHRCIASVQTGGHCVSCQKFNGYFVL